MSYIDENTFVNALLYESRFQRQQLKSVQQAHLNAAMALIDNPDPANAYQLAYCKLSHRYEELGHYKRQQIRRLIRGQHL